MTAIESLIVQARTSGGIPPTQRMVPFENIGALLRMRAAEHPDKVWLIDYTDQAQESGRPVRYGEFYGMVARTANYLLSRGIRRGDRVATISVNHLDTVVQYFAMFLIGAVAVPINVGEDDKRIGYILRDSRSRLAFVRDQYLDRLKNIPGAESVGTVVRVSSAPAEPGAAIPDFHAEIAGQPVDLHLDSEAGPDDEALLVYTSGTTGLPKGVVLTQYNLLIDARAIAEWHGMTPDQRMMCVLPIHHVNGTVVTLMTPLYYGGSVVLNGRFHTDQFFPRIALHKVHVVSVVPTLLQFLLHENPDLGAYDLAHFRHIICGAGPLTVELANRFEDRFRIPVIHGYGLSETTCYSCFLPVDLTPEEHRHWMTDFGFPSIGIPIPPNEMAIHDDRGSELPEATRGEIVIRGHNVMKCYHGNPEANAASFTHGWFRSGDEGFYRRDPNGRMFFFITGRIKELIIRGGTNISPFEIDEVLMKMPGVKAGLAVGFENDWYGEEVGAYVQPDGRTPLSEAEVINYCRKFFSFQKCPKVVLFGNDIPVTSTGKYQRGKLRPLFGKWKEAQFTESRHEERRDPR
jgi:acyl-CoA synthetase (AMP-forming)/AMP-acid ligase II